MSYFRGINYSLGNEDTSLEYNILKQEKCDSILCITGSGARFTPFLAENPKNIWALDLSQEQCFLAELKMATAKTFSQDDYLKFWAYPPHHQDSDSNERKKMFHVLALSDSARQYFLEFFTRENWASLLYKGKWERTFKTLSCINNFIAGRSAQALFKCTSLEEQKKYFEKSFPRWRWNFIVRLLGNKQVFDALLYKGHFIKKNVPESFYSYYQGAFNALFEKNLARESFFMNLCFFGKILFKEANFIETQEPLYTRIQENLKAHKTQVSLLQWDLLKAVERLQEKTIDFCSLSDVPSYFSGEMERDYLQKLKPLLKKGALVIVRYYLRVAEANTESFEDVTSRYSDFIAREKVQMYRVKIYRFSGK